MSNYVTVDSKNAKLTRLFFDQYYEIGAFMRWMGWSEADQSALNMVKAICHSKLDVEVLDRILARTESSDILFKGYAQTRNQVRDMMRDEGHILASYCKQTGRDLRFYVWVYNLTRNPACQRAIRYDLSIIHADDDAYQG